MTVRQWSQGELLGLAHGGRVMALDEAAGTISPPDWLQAVAAEGMEYDSSEAVERLHPDDRSRLIDLYLSALEQPGELRNDRFRAVLDDRWAHVDVGAVNLLGDPAVGCVLVVTREVDGEAIDDPTNEADTSHAVTDWMLLTLNGSGRITTVEGNAEAMLGYRSDELIGEAPTSLIHPDHLVDSIRLWRALVEQPDETRTSQRRWITKGGDEIWIESSYVNRGDGFADEVRYLVVMWDITERRAAEQALREREGQLVRMADDFRSLADEVPAAVFRCTATGSVVFHNSYWVDVLQGRSEVERLHDLLDPDSRETLDAALLAGWTPATAERETVELTGDDGTIWRLTLRTLATATGGPSDFLGSLQDISLTVRLRKEATHDALTGLINRPAFEAELDQVLADGDGDAVVAFIDLDRFKAVNDDWGHDAGDAILIEVARRLKAAIRSSDSVGRWGGDEFVVLFRNVTAVANQTLTGLLERAFEQPVDFGLGAWDPAASIGAAQPRAGDGVHTVIGRADQAMLARKRQQPDQPR